MLLANIDRWIISTHIIAIKTVRKGDEDNENIVVFIFFVIFLDNYTTS